MTYRQIVKHIKSIRWYRQGGALRLFYIFEPYHCVHETIGYDRSIIYQKGEQNTAFFDKTRQTVRARWLLQKQLRDGYFIDKWIKAWAVKSRVALKLCEQYFKKPIESWSDGELAKFLRKFSALTTKQWIEGVLIEWFDPEGETLLHQLINGFGIKLTARELEDLISPEALTFNQAELISRLAIAERLVKGQAVDRLLTVHTRRFYWYKNTWAYVYDLDAKHFAREIKKNAETIKVLKHEVAHIKKQLACIKKARRRILKLGHVPRELRNIFYLFRRMAEWRDYRKQMSCCIPNHYLYHVLKRLADENKIPFELAGFLTPREITGWRIPTSLRRELKQRSRAAIWVCSSKKECKWWYGRAAVQFYTLLNRGMISDSISGTVAQRGVVSGRVRIIETVVDFSKMKRGDILVAQMTRPEYLPVIKLAGAIITDEGGLTCHAAVVSREFKIPCIVGTQVATHVLKNGDWVKVDATKGVVKKI